MPDKRSSVPLHCLGLDWGLRRVGVAYGTAMLGTATPLGTIDAQGDARWQALAHHIEQWQPAAVVIGVPRHPDGAAHDNTRRAQRFARQVASRFGLPVHTVDERYTTTEAHAAAARDADAAAAVLILEQFFREAAEGAAAESANVQPKAAARLC